MAGTEKAKGSELHHKKRHSRSGSISRSLSRASWRMEEVFATATSSRTSSQADEDEEALKWAAIEKLPTYDRLRTSIIKSLGETEPQGVHKQVDVLKLDMNDRQDFIQRIFKVAEEDNETFLKKFRSRLDK